MDNKKIVWDKKATNEFLDIIGYIAKDSPQNAEKIIVEVFEKIELLRKNPEVHPPDKYKIINDGSYRAFEFHRVRIAYHVSSNEIRVLRIRNTYRKPLNY